MYRGRPLPPVGLLWQKMACTVPLRFVGYAFVGYTHTFSFAYRTYNACGNAIDLDFIRNITEAPTAKMHRVSM